MTERTMELEKQQTQTPTNVERTRQTRAYMPNVDIFETGDRVILLADMPGVSEDSLDITLEKNVLTIRGYTAAQAPEGFQPAYAEYGVGNYERTFALSDEVDRNQIEATIKNGVLRLEMPKAETAKTRKITVKAQS
ncbi:MAG: Hsp20/alpha crystallin family protein [Chloroflexi bacterium]|nr:Hsp20/alpha crystallin family protein [Chloroflexota bacterium]MCI0577613.1 Hsp20/alpha crystallin family protein [Chloroflexota bacterium]MCI0644167.1 Hsp20/alpha crystallin family protein [Chloroflexota bacterium]MCI0725250.1 Hsp20/alpha crystallin family protein [Chloroflexota bacterium]